MQDHGSVDTLLAGGVPNVVEHTLCPSNFCFFYVINFSFCGYVDLLLHGCTVVLLYLSISRALFPGTCHHGRGRAVYDGKAPLLATRQFLFLADVPEPQCGTSRAAVG